MSRNFGQHAAITAGLAHSRGQWTVVMDCDLQDDPADIARLYETALQGYDLVLTRRAQRGSSAVRRLASRLYFWLLSQAVGTPVGATGSFSIISAKVRNEALRLRERDRHYIFVLTWLGFNQGLIDVAQHKRFAGASAYSWSKLLQHGIDGLFFQSTRALKAIVALGFATALGGALLAVIVVLMRILSRAAPGWASTFVAILLVGGVIIVSVGVTGIYVGKVFLQVKERPLYVIDVTIDSIASRGMPAAMRSDRAPARDAD
jgi:dolichol-phosphate mannosyltransferase